MEGGNYVRKSEAEERGATMSDEDVDPLVLEVVEDPDIGILFCLDMLDSSRLQYRGDRT